MGLSRGRAGLWVVTSAVLCGNEQLGVGERIDETLIQWLPASVGEHDVHWHLTRVIVGAIRHQVYQHGGFPCNDPRTEYFISELV